MTNWTYYAAAVAVVLAYAAATYVLGALGGCASTGLPPPAPKPVEVVRLVDRPVLPPREFVEPVKPRELPVYFVPQRRDPTLPASTDGWACLDQRGQRAEAEIHDAHVGRESALDAWDRAARKPPGQ